MYFGEGKGKTTAAVGLAARALGRGWGVVFLQFLKSRPAGEVSSLEKLGATVLRGKSGSHFSWDMTDDEKRMTLALSDGNLRSALAACEACGSPVMLVLDEICAAWQHCLVDRPLVETLVREVKAGTRPLELVLTGRNPPQLFLSLSDYVTEFRKIRHPFDSGRTARQGVEF